MLSAKDASIIYETLLCSPGMNDNVKISLQLPRKNVLLLTKIIDHGLATKHEGQNGILSLVNDETVRELSVVSVELLKKAGLTEMNEKLNFLSNK